jgi:hypothetical protein
VAGLLVLGVHAAEAITLDVEEVPSMAPTSSGRSIGGAFIRNQATRHSKPYNAVSGIVAIDPMIILS